MVTREVKIEEKDAYNKVVDHPLQSWEWGEFRTATGQKAIRIGNFEGAKITSGYQVLLNYFPKVPFTVGTLLRGPMPDQTMLNTLSKIGTDNKTIFIKIEPLIGGPVVTSTDGEIMKNLGFEEIDKFLLENGCFYGKPLFPKHTFWLDLTQTEGAILAKMHPKTRYNLHLAEKNGVVVTEDNSPKGFETFLRLHFETASREGFYSHSEDYHRKMWTIMQPAGIAHLLVASYKNVPLVSWVLFNFNKTLYYPYGGSNREHREVMPSYLMMWSAIKLGKKLGCKNFDMWGTPGSNPGPKDPWIGFHRFKQGFGPQLVEFLGSYDYVTNPSFYRLYNLAESARWKVLRTKAKIGTIFNRAKQYVSQYSPVS